MDSWKFLFSFRKEPKIFSDFEWESFKVFIEVGLDLSWLLLKSSFLNSFIEYLNNSKENFRTLRFAQQWSIINQNILIIMKIEIY